MKIAGAILVVIGLVGLLYGGITYTRREKILDIGPIEATAERRETIPLPPIFGAVAVVAGVVLLVAGARRR
jgi:xanthosine utilization system XapX-like protein